MTEQCETTRKPLYDGFKGAVISEIKYDGGDMSGTNVQILLEDGRTFNINSQLDISDFGIKAKISRTIGIWGKVERIEDVSQNSI